MRILHFLQTWAANIHNVKKLGKKPFSWSVYFVRRNLDFDFLLHSTLCWRRRKGSSISMPPSWTIHHTSMWPSVKRSPLDGKAAMFFGTSRARWAAVVSLTSSAEQTHREAQRCWSFYCYRLSPRLFCCSFNGKLWHLLALIILYFWGSLSLHLLTWIILLSMKHSFFSFLLYFYY